LRNHFCVRAFPFIALLGCGAAWSQQPGQLQDPATNLRQAPSQPPAVLSIPAVAERPLSSDAGPRVRVTAFDLKLDSVLSASVTSEVLEGARAILSDKVRSQPDVGMTIGELEAVALEVTQHFRNSGFALASAYLPSQSVQDGRVEIATLPGALGQITAEGNDRYSVAWLSLPFENLQGRPVNVAELESAVLRVRDYPGVAPAAVLSPGKEVGTTDLTLRVSEWPVDFGMTADNYGSTFNGEYRARAWTAWNNPLGHADRLYLDVLQAFEPTENTYGSVSYMTGLGHPMLSGGIEYSVSAFDIDEDIRETYAGNPINGEAEILSIPLTAQLVRSRDLSLGVTFAYSRKRSSFDDLAASGGAFNREDEEDVFGLSLDMQFVDRWFGSALGVNSIRLSYDYGDLSGDDGPPAVGEPCETTRQDGEGNCVAGSFTKGAIEISRLQQLFRANSLLFRGFYQFSGDTLVSLEQLSLGGFYSIRAYPTSQELFDEGGFASLEWHVDIHNLLATRPQNWDLTAFLSADYGSGSNNKRFEGEASSTEMAGWGGGLQFQYRFGTRWAMEARFDVATAEDDYEGTLPPNDDDDPRYWGWLSLSYR